MRWVQYLIHSLTLVKYSNFSLVKYIFFMPCVLFVMSFNFIFSADWKMHTKLDPQFLIWITLKVAMFNMTFMALTAFLFVMFRRNLQIIANAGHG